MHLQRRTEEEKARYHSYDSAERVIAAYKEELGTETARPMNARLKDFGLPTLPDVKETFLRLAGESTDVVASCWYEQSRLSVAALLRMTIPQGN